MRLLFVLFCLVIFTPNSHAQEWDHEKYPRLEIDIEHMNADLNVSQNGSIEGDVLYRAVVQSPAADSLEFHAAALEILSVEINDTETAFTLNDDRMAILPEQPLQRGETVNIRIRYTASPQFGILRNTRGTLWSSMLPKTTRHWIPVKDHPLERFTTELMITFPAGLEMVASGQRASSEIISVDEERVGFHSEVPVSPVHLAWTIGNLNLIGQSELPIENASDDIVQLSVYSETALPDTLGVVEIAEDAFQSVSDLLGTAYPRRSLHLVFLEESYGEVKSYGSGIVFIYLDKANIADQIRSGIVSQWAGVEVSEKLWSDADGILAVHSFISNLLFDMQPDTVSADQPYESFSGNSYSRWRHFLKNPEGEPFREVLELEYREIFDNGLRALGWSDLSELVYRSTGLPFFDGFDPDPVTIETEEVLQYSADVEWDDTQQTVEVSFQATGQPVDELVTVRATEKRFDGTREHTVTFTGSEDRSVISVSPAIENLQLEIVDRGDIELDVSKPFMFWIDQLRDDSDPEERIEAAEALADFSDNPDLQLALNDLLGVESHPAVYAEILRSLSKLTAGDAGMEQRFLPYISEDRNRVIRLAAIEALGTFKGNEQVIGQLRSLIINTDDPELQREAVHSLASVADAGRYRSVVSDLVTRESVLHEVPLLLNTLAEKGEAEAVAEMASTFISQQFPFDVRREALSLLLRYDRSPENWSERLPILFNDSHPIIRVHAADALRYLSDSEREEWVPALMGDSYDERVRNAIESVAGR